MPKAWLIIKANHQHVNIIFSKIRNFFAIAIILLGNKHSLWYILGMKKHLSKRSIFAIIISAVILLTGVILLCMGKMKESVFAFIPFPFCIWTFFSFYYPKDVQKHTGLLFLSIASRFICNLISMLIPALIWKFVPSFYNSISGYWILLPFIEIMLTYISYTATNILEKKEDEGK